MKNLLQKYPVLGSSVDPEKLSLTIKSAGLALVPVLILIARGFDLELVENDFVQIINAVATVVSMAGVIYGVARKFIK